MKTYARAAQQREYYTQYYNTGALHDSHDFSRKKAQEVIRGIVRTLPNDSSYLGIGAGRGILESSLWVNCLEHLKRVRILDIAKRDSLLEMRNAENIKVDAHHLPIPENDVDLISSHLTQDFYDNRAQSTREMLRVLKPGRKAVIFLHHPESLRTMIRNGKKVELNGFYEELIRKRRVFSTREGIRRHYQRHGFIVESVVEHVPEEREKKSDYWWEVILKKPE